MREADGLAYSSRNQYLSESERGQAPVLRAALLEAAERVRGGETSAPRLIENVRERIAASPAARIDYVELVDAESLQPRAMVERELTPRSGRVLRPDSPDRQYPTPMKEYDFVVIGSGIAGLTFALKAARHGSRRRDHETQRRGLEHRLGAGRSRVRDER